MIQIQRLCLSVGTFALRDISLEVAPGEYFVLLGPSGSGKTMLVESLCGLNRIDSGRIAIDGVDVTRLEPRRRAIGYLPQDYALFPHRTVRRNVAFSLEGRPLAPHAVRLRAERLLELAGISHLADRLPGELDEQQTQRAMLARALAVNPDPLLPGEPPSVIDEPSVRRLIGRMEQLDTQNQAANGLLRRFFAGSPLRRPSRHFRLAPRQTVRQNVCAGLANRKLTANEVRKRVDPLLNRLGLAHLAGRLPDRLSGGEKQRVALARALAIEPKVLCLDEPVSALDEQTRDELCSELKRLQRSTQTTTLHVCHNFAEMLHVADRAGVIYNGRMLQVGTPREILERPKDCFVAQFVQAANVLAAEAVVDGCGVRLTCEGGIELRAVAPKGMAVPSRVFCMVRPENFHLHAALPENCPHGLNLVEGRLQEVTDLGPVVRLRVACGRGIELTVTLGRNEHRVTGVSVGDRLWLSVPRESIHVMEE